MMTQRDPSLFPSVLKAKARDRIRHIFVELEDVAKYVYYRPIYERMKPGDHKAINQAVKKALTPEAIQAARKAITDQDDRQTASQLRDIGERLEGVLSRMNSPKKRKR